MKARCYQWLRERDNRMFLWCNHTLSHFVLDRLLRWTTHIGSAACTILCMLGVILFAPEPWRGIGWQGLAALSFSHILAVIVKKKIQRSRPYEAIQGTKILINPLKDYSFPSGHTTAVFSTVTPFLFASDWISYLLLPLAFTVGLSRIYLGVHYPSDCMAGCLIGMATALLIVIVAG
ncbi:phosphatase PAP2 family protein [Paenibacillus sp. sptzw28]|uniref:phosphatase PAP2 family protein n=1 Tax=Paenibacillus sp. sptzw28 TaxID=715179 RepID=UPI001C6EC4F7|nr:phosphatase PAP2 family protein [Paenibacillus sp. sptzw28]QYR19412.1 phosphatase PAP2 family protein [Paenibacillus sp. sptzw28]